MADVSKAVVKSVTTMGAALVGFIEIAESIRNIAKEINKQLPVFLEHGIDIVLNLITGIIQSLPTLVASIVEIIPSIAKTLIGALADALLDPTNLTKLKETAPQIIKVLALYLGGKVALGKIAVAGKALAEKLTLSFKGYKGLKSLGGKVIYGIAKVLKGGKAIMFKAGSGIASAFTGALKGKGLLAAIGPKGWIAAGMIALGVAAFANRERIGEFFSNMGDKARESFPRVMEAVDGTVARIGEFVSNMRETGAEMVENFRSGFESRREEGFGVVSSFAGSVLDVLNDRLPKIFGVAVDAMGSFIDGFSSRRQEGYGLILSFAGGVLDAARSGLAGIREIGVNMMDGLKEGISSAAGRVVDSVQNVASRAINGARNILGINSPSKVFADIGEDSVDGYIVGLEKKEQDIYKTIREIFDIGKQDIGFAGDLAGVGVISTGAGRIADNKISATHQANKAKADIHYHFGANSIVIDAKSVKDFNDVVELLSDYAYSNRVYNGV